jgi:hypothetical protein
MKVFLTRVPFPPVADYRCRSQPCSVLSQRCAGVSIGSPRRGLNNPPAGREAGATVAPGHLRLPVRPQREEGVPACNRMLPEMRKRFWRLQKTARELGH